MLCMAGPVAFTLGIFHQQDVPSFKDPLFPEARFDLDLSVQQNDKLPGGSIVKIVIVSGFIFAEHQPAHGKTFRDGADGSPVL